MEFMTEFLKSFGLLAVIILGLTIFKISTCKPFKEDGETFDWKKLLIGLGGNALVAVAVGIVYAAGFYWGGEEAVVEIGTSTYSLIDALQLMLATAVVVYAKKFIVNFAEMLGILDKVPEIKEKLPVVVDYNESDEDAQG